jgi:predicted membrane chloride channel (bestrophin family)
MFTVLLVVIACHVYEEGIRSLHPSWKSLHDLDAGFAYSLTSFALSLLLIFKTNTSYARFWEARTAWSGVYTDCRHAPLLLVLLLSIFMPVSVVLLLACHCPCTCGFMRER